jgi:hypothetical protein
MTSRNRKKRPATPKSANPVQTQDRGQTLDWSRVKEHFYVWQSLFQTTNTPNWADLDRYWASVSSDGKIESNLGAKLKGDYSIYPGDEDRQDALKEALATLQNEDILKTIQVGIERKICDNQFFWAWTTFQNAAASLLALELASAEAKKDFNQREAQSSQIIQKYIYAFWMYDRWARKSRDSEILPKDAKIDADQSLAEKIEYIINENLLSVADRGWLKTMIIYKDEHVELHGKAVKLTAIQICQMVEFGKIKKEELPAIGY